MLGNFGQFYLKGVDTHGSTNGDNWEPYHLATTLKSHLLAYDVDKAGEGNMNYEVYDGWEIAADLLKRLESDKNKNLENWGVFASDANPPSEEEVKAAKRKLETNLNAIVMEGDLLSRGTSNEQKSIGERHRDAANYLKVTRDWAKPIEFLIACPFCGQAVMEDAPICKYCSNIIDKAKYDEVKASIDSKAKKAKNI